MSINHRLMGTHSNLVSATGDLEYTGICADLCTATFLMRYRGKVYRIVLVDGLGDLRKFRSEYTKHLERVKERGYVGILITECMKEKSVVCTLLPGRIPLCFYEMSIRIAADVFDVIEVISRRPHSMVLEYATKIHVAAREFTDGQISEERTWYENSILLIASRFVLNSDFADTLTSMPSPEWVSNHRFVGVARRPYTPEPGWYCDDE